MYMYYVIFLYFAWFVFSCSLMFLFYFVKPKYSEVKKGWNMSKNAFLHPKIPKVTNK